MPISDMAEELAKCPERVRVYLMGLEHCHKTSESILQYNSKLQEEIIAAHVAGLPENWEYQDPFTTIRRLASECAMLRRDRLEYSAAVAQIAEVFGVNTESPSDSMGRVLAEIMKCREAQDVQWGGPAHDDTHSAIDWLHFIDRFRTRAGLFVNHEIHEQFLIDIAALAVAAIQSGRRKRTSAKGLQDA